MEAMQFAIILLIAVVASASKIKLEKNAEMSHKLIKRHCSCQPSSCSCASVQLNFQFSCSCPQTCKCPSPVQPIYPPVTYTMPTTTLPPITPIPVFPTQSPYCCVLFICASCSYYGNTYNELQPQPQYRLPSNQYYLPPPPQYNYPAQPPLPYNYQVPVHPSTYSYPTTTSTCSIGFTICFGGSFCCRN